MRTWIRAALATVAFSIVAAAGGCGGGGPSDYLISPIAGAGDVVASAASAAQE